MSLGPGCQSLWGPGGQTERPCRNSRRGSSFQPQVSFCYLDYISPPPTRMEEPLRFSDRHGIRQEGLIVPAESVSLGLKVETNGLASSN